MFEAQGNFPSETPLAEVRCVKRASLRWFLLRGGFSATKAQELGEAYAFVFILLSKYEFPMKMSIYSFSGRCLPKVN